MTGCDGLTSFFVSNEQEVQLGFEVSKEIDQDYTLFAEDDPVTQWATQLVDGMTPAADAFRESEKFDGYKVHVIDDNSLVNAFAAPGGFVYIASGLVLASDTCAEVAGVVGHEMAHVTERHSAKSLAKNAATLGLSDFLLNDGITKDIAEGVYVFAMQTHFSRKDESAADRVGAEIMYETGYNPYALADMFRFLGDQGTSPNKLTQFFSSHPESTERANTIEKQIEDSWDDVQKTGGQYTYGCLGTTLDFQEVKTRLAD